MMASKYQSSNETTNFARLSRLMVDVISDLLRAVLNAKVPPPGLTAILHSQKNQLCKNLESYQKQKLYPSGGVFVGTLKDLDITLLYRLLRNLQCINIPPHQKGWGNKPDITDRSLSANIDRLRVQRNEAYGHLPTASLSDSDFKKSWSLIRQSVEEIEKDALTGDTYVTAVDALLTMNMDPEAEKSYIEELEKQHKADLKVKAILKEVKATQEVMATDISAMATEISTVTTRQKAMATDISVVTSRQETMATDISDVTTRQETMATDISEISTRQETISNRQEDMERDLHNLQGDVVAMNVKKANTRQNKKIHPDLVPMIETTKAKTNKEKDKKFYPTEGFCDAKEKLLQNRIVVIKGNTGDGKTAIAYQLLHWLSQERHAGQPLQIHKIKKLGLLSPNLKLITFIDDIFGEKDVCKKDVQEWNKRISDVETLFLDEQTENNYLLITIRNEIFNSLEKRSCGKIFTTCNIIDLSSHTYKIKEEKKELLEMYTPEKFTWSKNEQDRILTCTPDIGFPQCCQLFYNSEKLQEQRVAFFKSPFHFLNEALSRLDECSALLFLFLNNGIIRVKDLDPNSRKVNETLLEEAFDINLIDGESDRTRLTYKKKLGFVRDSLEKLLGCLVVKEKDWRSDHDDAYKFSHDSVDVAVALLYGKVTPIGYIQNCPSESLSYLTTSETATNMIVVTSDLYSYLCERLFRELECKSNYRIIVSLDVFHDPEFMEQLGRLMNDSKVDKLAMLNEACDCFAEKCVLYLLSEGVKPDRNTALSLVSRDWKDSDTQVSLLRKVAVNLNDETKLALLMIACGFGAEKCVLYFLSEGVKPPKNIRWLELLTQNWNDSNIEMSLLRQIIVYLNDETKLDVLNKACGLGVAKCVLCLLSEGVTPDKATALYLVSTVWKDSDTQVSVLRKFAVNLNDEAKLAVLNRACRCALEKCVLYLLSEGVTPDKDTALYLVSTVWKDSDTQVSLLRKVAVNLNDEAKLSVLNKACYVCEEKCVLCLLTEGVKPDKDTAIALVSTHWNDSDRQVSLLKKFVVNLNDEAKLAVLNEACRCATEKCVLYLWSEGVTPDKDTALSLVQSVRGCWDNSDTQLSLLRKVVVNLNDEAKLDVLNKACYGREEKCVLYLLTEGVKPDKDTAIALVSRYWTNSDTQVSLLRKVVVNLNDEAKLDVLNKACYGREEKCVLCLLTEGVKPDKDSAIALVSRYWTNSDTQVSLLRKVAVNLNDEAKLAVLNKACRCSAEKCVLYLWSEGVTPDKDTALSLVQSVRACWDNSDTQVSLLRKVAVNLNDEAKLAVLNEACRCSAEKCVLYLWSEGVTPDKDTALSLVQSRACWDNSDTQLSLLRKVVVNLNDEAKLDVLNKACYFRAENCVLYLLSERVKPDKSTPWFKLIIENWNESFINMSLLRKIVVYLNDETKLNVLNNACLCGVEKCVLYFLSEGVKPDKDTALALVRGDWNDSDRQVRLLKKFVVNLNDEAKLTVLNEACRCGVEKCVLYLLIEGVEPDDGTALAMVRRDWKDSNVQECFIRNVAVNLNDVTKLDVLSEACRCGAEKCVLYLLSEDIKPDKDTALALVSGHWNDSDRKVSILKIFVVNLNDEAKLAVLNEACSEGEEKCVLYLLSEGVKPDKDTALSLVSGDWDDSDRQECLIRKVVVNLNDEAKLAMLNKACSFRAEKCVLCLLSEGVKPDKVTALSLVNAYWESSDTELSLLRKVVVNLNDEAKLDVLNKACSFRAEKCVLYLLSEGVTPDMDTAFALVSGDWNDSDILECLLRKVVVNLNDEAKAAVLNKACSGDKEECVLYLLSEGVKPDKDTALALVSGDWNDSDRQECLLKKIVVNLNDEAKVAILNAACWYGAEKCALYLLGEGVEPDKETVFDMVEGRSEIVLLKLLHYEITSTVRDRDNNNVLHKACEYQREAAVTVFCNTYPHLVHYSNKYGKTPLFVAARTGSCSLFQRVEKCVLNSLYTVEDQKHKCESVDGRMVHRNCVCAQYMAELVDNTRETVLDVSCEWRNRDVCEYLRLSYPALATSFDENRFSLL